MNEAEFFAHYLNRHREEVELPQCERRERLLRELGSAQAGDPGGRRHGGWWLRSLARRIGQGIAASGERLAEVSGDPYWPGA